MTLHQLYAEGLDAAWQKFAAGLPAHPVVSGSTVLGGKSPAPVVPPPQPLTPEGVSGLFNAQEQVATKQDPDRKLAGEAICTSCRKPKHYGPCKKPDRLPPGGAPHKAANFNSGLYGGGSDNGQTEAPSMSPYFTAGTVADSGPARARPGRPEDQVRSTHQDFQRPSFQNQLADQSTNLYGGLIKTQALKVFPRLKSAGPIFNNSGFERRGPTGDDYPQQLLRQLSHAARGPVGDQAVDKAFGQIDCAADSTNIESGGGQPQGGPAALG